MRVIIQEEALRRSEKTHHHQFIHELPTIEAVPAVHGQWLHSDGKSIVWYCSECGGKILYNPNPRTYNIKKPKVEQYNKFCRNCGAKMNGGAQE